MKDICKKSFVNSFAVAVYISVVALFMNNAEKIFGKMDTIISAMAFLLLFSLSALVVGWLLAGKPIFLYIDGKKKEAVYTIMASAGWLLLFFLIVLGVMLIIK